MSSRPGAIGRRREVLVLDMGEPVKIAEVAALLAARAPRQIEIVFTGLRDGEKLHEVLFGTGERDSRPFPHISHVEAPPLAPAATTRLDPRDCPAACSEGLRQLCTVDAAAAEGTNGVAWAREH